MGVILLQVLQVSGSEDADSVVEFAQASSGNIPCSSLLLCTTIFLLIGLHFCSPSLYSHVQGYTHTHTGMNVTPTHQTTVTGSGGYNGSCGSPPDTARSTLSRSVLSSVVSVDYYIVSLIDNSNFCHCPEMMPFSLSVQCDCWSWGDGSNQ